MWGTKRFFVLPAAVWFLFSFVFAEREIKSICLEEILSIGGLEKDVIFAWSDLATDPQGNIYILDFMDYSMKKFDDKGTLLLKKGRMGQGPGEFISPRLIRFFEGRVYVSDLYKPGIQVFDTDLNYLEKIPLALPVVDLEITDPGRFIISSPSAPSPSGLMTVGRKGLLKTPSKRMKEGEAYWSSFTKFARDKQKNIYLQYTFADRIEKFNKDNTKMWSASLLGNIKAEFEDSTAKGGPSKLPQNVVFKNITLDRFGYVFILGGHLSRHRSRDIYVLDPSSGKRIFTFTLPFPSHTITFDQKNHLYSAADEGTCVKKYALTYRFKEKSGKSRDNKTA
ncbi:MAG: hypothetical protein JXB26_03930 [Candidatus Aminicenantes bacterium]|nr:hypothetical protein [Candidatus Aminicenantes bacterium]